MEGGLVLHQPGPDLAEAPVHPGPHELGRQAGVVAAEDPGQVAVVDHRPPHVGVAVAADRLVGVPADEEALAAGEVVGEAGLGQGQAQLGEQEPLPERPAVEPADDAGRRRPSWPRPWWPGPTGGAPRRRPRTPATRWSPPPPRPGRPGACPSSRAAGRRRGARPGRRRPRPARPSRPTTRRRPPPPRSPGRPPTPRTPRSPPPRPGPGSRPARRSAGAAGSGARKRRAASPIRASPTRLATVARLGRRARGLTYG